MQIDRGKTLSPQQSGARLLALTPPDKIMVCKYKTRGRTACHPLSIPGTAFLPWEYAEFGVPIDERGLFVLARASSSSGIARVRESPDLKDLKVSVSVPLSQQGGPL